MFQKLAATCLKHYDDYSFKELILSDDEIENVIYRGI